ncbi:hypothetical protein LP417_23740 [Polaromonas sp. P1-6]|nr:hypothetical protein LP417_23740 [Polaromonas sp. P1-6]
MAGTHKKTTPRGFGDAKLPALGIPGEQEYLELLPSEVYRVVADIAWAIAQDYDIKETKL